MPKYHSQEIEKHWQAQWAKQGTYAYQKSVDKEDFVIDTPPPTVSGALHIGHIFSYTQTDIIARFKRMRGYNVFYPMGWDDNGLPTEKRVQNLYGVQCDPQREYDPDFKGEKKPGRKRIYQGVSRKNFLEICRQQVLEDEVKYKQLWNHIALSVDWNYNYQTISLEVQKISQHSFRDLFNKNLVENRSSPVLWDTQFQTAVAQADVEDREQKTFYNDIVFKVLGGGEFVISTTRPEMLPACVAVVAHPKDERYKKFFGQSALTPLFNRRVPVLASEHADPEKGTGILMVCTFGDREDVSFCKKQALPTLPLISDQGFLLDIDFHRGLFKSEEPSLAQKNYQELKGLRVVPARKKIVEILKQKSFLRGEPKPATHKVKFYEKGDFPLEILSKRQWYIKLLDYREELLEQANKIQWWPESMKKRYQQWVEGLNQDWCISRQRVFGVPFPVWYALDAKGEIQYDRVLLPNKDFSELKAIDPLKDCAPGFEEKQRDQPLGFTADKDVMDTWATSSLTPLINSRWIFDKNRHKRFFPADLRPQAHEIIRTWAFYSIVKAYFHEKSLPWRNIAVSGWVLTPDRDKMSKSKGNALTPENLIQTYSADGVRYWAGKASLGQDTIYDENLFKTGQKLVRKIFNASQFVFLQIEGQKWQAFESCWEQVSEPIDQAWLLSLLKVKQQALLDLESYQHQKALKDIETHFWLFCDDYLELIKARAYRLKGSKKALSATSSLDFSLFLFLQLFAPYLPYITEEIWQKRYSVKGQSLHQFCYFKEKLLKSLIEQLKQRWNHWNSLGDNPEDSLEDSVGDSPVAKKTLSLESLELNWNHLYNLKEKLEPDFFLESLFSILREIRKQKSSAGKSLATPLKEMELLLPKKEIFSVDLGKQDLCMASHLDLKNLKIKKSPSSSRTITLKME